MAEVDAHKSTAGVGTVDAADAAAQVGGESISVSKSAHVSGAAATRVGSAQHDIQGSGSGQGFNPLWLISLKEADRKLMLQRLEATASAVLAAAPAKLNESRQCQALVVAVA